MVPLPSMLSGFDPIKTATPQRRNAATPQRRNAATPQRRNAATPQRRAKL
jgi:hypothetical protein